jgi:hypothetical protein
MMPEEWPIAAAATDESAPAAGRRARGRLRTVRIDFFLDPKQRLTEQERALMSVMLNRLIGDVASALRAALPGGWLAANDGDDADLINRLKTAKLLDDAGLIAVVLQRADEERISLAARARGGCKEARVLQGLVSNNHGGVAASAMALILARGRRRDRFGQCLVAIDDLAAVTAGHLITAVAAALRAEVARSRGAADADRELSAAARQVREQRDAERGIARLTTALIRELDDAGALSDDLVLAAANEGEVMFVGAALARRAGLLIDDALDDLLSGDGSRMMILCRAAHASRELAAGLLAGIGDLLGIGDAVEAVERFDKMTPADVDAAKSWLSTDRDFRAALERLDDERG